MPLNDEEVQQEMRKMVAFIKQEAVEKAKELQVKADEEFNIEKAKLVRHETATIETNFNRKMKQAEVSRKIAQSSLLNKMRLEVLQVRDQCLNELYEEARDKLKYIPQDASAYAQLLKDLILQCLYQLMESSVTIQCRKQDKEIIEKQLNEISQKFKENTMKPVQIIIDSDFLNAECNGGVAASCLDGKIRIDNTLEARLDLLFQKMLPEIRASIIGFSKSRRFFD